MKTLQKVDKAATERLVCEVLPLLPPAAVALFNAATVAVTNHRAGRADHRHQVARVPSWVFRDRINFCSKGLIDGGPKFAAYYLAHELAHLVSTDGHGPKFMAAFRELCPPELQHYELKYKPRSAAAAGIAG